MDKIKLRLNLIFKNEYYTNHGPLAKEMEMYLIKKTGFKNAVSVSNYVIAILMVIELFKNKKNLYFEMKNCPKVLKNFVTTNLKILNKPSDKSINFLTYRNKKKITKKSVYISNKLLKNNIHFADILNICNLEFYNTKNYIFTGSIIFTNNDILAEKLRNIRSSYGTNKTVEVYRTSNGRFSEFQAAFFLSKFSKIN